MSVGTLHITMETDAATTLDSRTTQPVTSHQPLRDAGLLFAILAGGFVTVIMLAAAMVPGYDFNTAAISDLGVFPETALLFNASLVLVGLLNIAGGYRFFQVHHSRLLLGTFVLAGLGAITAGAFTLESAPGIHGIGALLAFLFFNLEAIGSGVRFDGLIRYLSVLLGALGIVFVVVMALGDAGAISFGAIGHGGAERMIVYPPMLWLLTFGGFLVGRSASA